MVVVTWRKPGNSTIKINAENSCYFDNLHMKEKDVSMPLGTINIVMSLCYQQRSYATYRPPHNIPFTLLQNVFCYIRVSIQYTHAIQERHSKSK